MEEKLKVLSNVAKAMNGAQITWALGASALLYLHGLVAEFHDLDLMVTEADIYKAQTVLDALGARQPKRPAAQYRTKFFLEYQICGVDVDVMAGFVIVTDGEAHPAPFHADHIDGAAEVFGSRVPLQKLSDWAQYYAWMGRTNKSALIRDKLNREP